MKTIRLRDGVFALVDDDDYESVNCYSWFLFRCTGQSDYAYRYVRDGHGKRKRIFMHRQILPHELPHTDHIDGNGLNNQKYNLRPAYCFQNVANSKIRSTNTSGFKGVCFVKKMDKWCARIRDRRINKEVYLGAFVDKIDAARAYDKAAINAYGEFAFTNFKSNEPPTATEE